LNLLEFVEAGVEEFGFLDGESRDARAGAGGTAARSRIGLRDRECRRKHHRDGKNRSLAHARCRVLTLHVGSSSIDAFRCVGERGESTDSRLVLRAN
jgi:hypothetical protein